jgi:RNA polymerase sigma factor (sigma-70 family)
VTPDAVELAVDHHGFAVAVVRHIIPDPDDAQSLAGWAICQAAQEWVDKGLDGEFRRWAGTFVRRRAADELRVKYGRKGQRLGIVQAQSLEVPVGDGITVEGTLADPVDDYARVDDQVDAPWFSKTIHQRLEKLSPRKRKAALLYGEGLTLRETAEHLGVTESRVCQIISEVRKVLTGIEDSGPAACRSSGTPFAAGPGQ